jgi:hypothetical protein
MDDEKQMARVQKIPLTELVPFKDHPFKVVEDESMLRTTESVFRRANLLYDRQRKRKKAGTKHSNQAAGESD